MQDRLLKYRGTYHTKVIIYPEPLEVGGLQKFFTREAGEERSPHSYHKDVYNLQGVRDYLPTDDVRHIHWKASLRTHSLQTKVYEQQQNNKLMFMINVSETSRLGNVYVSNKLERIFSQATYISYYAAKQGYPFDVHINIQQAGGPYVRHASTGKAKVDLKSALELFAYTDGKSLPLDFSKVVYDVGQSRRDHTMIVMGEVNEQTAVYLRHISKRQRVYHVKEGEDMGYIVPFL
nr:DUF58 domain-containing protein [Thalassobacillus sp. CUG 92003]